MHKQAKGEWDYCGVDVSARHLVAARRWQGQDEPLRTFANDAAGQRGLLQWLGPGRRVRVVLEATGVYGLALARRLHGRTGIEVAVVNPRVARRFADSLGQRSKSDPVDARALREYAARMPFTAWCPPSPQAWALRTITRQIAALKRLHTQDRNRLHATTVAHAPVCVRRELRRMLKTYAGAVRRLQAQALRLVLAQAQLRARFHLLLTVPGVAQTSALQLLGELAVLPEEMEARQWVAHCGLDPQQHTSGSSVLKPARISKRGNPHLRRALYMPALVAVRADRHLAALYRALQQRGKKKLQALVAVMRKLLHGIRGVFRHQQPFSVARLCPALASEVA